MARVRAREGLGLGLGLGVRARGLRLEGCRASTVPSVHMPKTWVRTYPPPQPTATVVTARSTLLGG